MQRRMQKVPLCPRLIFFLLNMVPATPNMVPLFVYAAIARSISDVAIPLFICHCEQPKTIPVYAVIARSISSAPPTWGRVVALRQRGFILVFIVIARSTGSVAIPVYNGRPLSVYNRVNNKPKVKPKNKTLSPKVAANKWPSRAK